MADRKALQTAEVIAVGSELLGSGRVDTNSLLIADELAKLGIELRAKAVVGDERADLAAIFRAALERADLIVFTGGLGPTDDDLTREVVADVLGLPIEVDAAIVAKIEERFARRGLRMPDVNRKQAAVPRGAAVLPNALGTAPGLLIERGDQVIVLLPGPPREMKALMEALCAGTLTERAGDARLYRASLFIAGRTESHVEEIAQPVYSRWRDANPSITTTILASPGQIELHLTARDADAARGPQAVERARDELVALFGEDVFTTKEEPLELVTGNLLRARRYTIAAAESCTGGLFTSRLTDVAGSSDYVRGSVVSYANEIKEELLAVPHDVLVRHGAVSEPVALAMAEGVRSRTGADVAVGITGIAGPGGATPQKPVGTVVVAVLVPGKPPFVKTHSLFGNRTQIKFNSAQAALDRVRRLLLN